MRLAATDIFAPAHLSDPFAFDQRAIAEAPVLVLDQGVVLVTGYAAVAEALGRPQDFSSDFTALLAGGRAEQPHVRAILDRGWPQVATLLTADPPVHTRFRRLVGLAFSLGRVDAIEATIRRHATALVATLPCGDCEFVADFAVPLPVRVIAGEIGLGPADTARVKRWTDAFVDRLGGTASEAREIECAELVVEFQHAIIAEIARRRDHPADDLLGDLVAARLEGERPLDDAELLSIVQQLMVAGNETTTATLAHAMLVLATNPHVADGLRADPASIAPMVDEVLRLASPVAASWRIALHDTLLGDIAIASGARLLLRLAAANRDPARFPDPARFDRARPNARAHLAFGRGIHMCIGNMLSRREVAVALELLVARFDRIVLGCARDDLLWPPNVMLRGLAALPLRLA